ncbi:MAG: multiheme c-type cytochrome [Candidatus Acidiferrales bacterium]
MSLAAVSLVSGLALFGQSPPTNESSSNTQDRVNQRDWWPTKGSIPMEGFAGAKACSECHAEKSGTQANTPMAKAALKIGARAPDREFPLAALELGTYQYQISSIHRRPTLVVSSGTQSVAATIAWIFGLGVHGETYILEKDGAFYESQVSNFAGLHGMALTPGHVQVEAGNLEGALGERLSTSGAVRCFGCHTTYSSTSSKFGPEHAVAGVHCEACHGPGLKHVNAMRAGQTEEGMIAIFNPAKLSPAESVDFCGACHRTTLDVVTSAEAYGPINVRFQPYRLEKSRCWGTNGDGRLTCVACHDPHVPLVRTASFYDQRCLECHAATSGTSPKDASAPAICPVATANCTSCHMPKSEVSEMHAKFTDHFIRIVRAGEPYPN